jgi:hypothetical protein
VKDEYSTATGYQATIVGKNGWLILCLGDRANKQGFDGYTLAASNYSSMDGHNERFEMWVNSSVAKRNTTGIDKVPSDQVPSTKVLRDGQLYLMYEGRMYDVQGRRVN